MKLLVAQPRRLSAGEETDHVAVRAGDDRSAAVAARNIGEQEDGHQPLFR
jgi:hypothetical protein